ncbi:hypothetical protein MLD38_036518 [Melastoma candidum]|uniref:Uncharacterized protein n=1 Tax=Melastoma candidum TaxID=119954 RepID=A0ACB9LK64_9MYRT|nr:hypothetical protein MLD38_036518 [Melastoma candidum]
MYPLPVVYPFEYEIGITITIIKIPCRPRPTSHPREAEQIGALQSPPPPQSEKRENVRADKEGEPAWLELLPHPNPLPIPVLALLPDPHNFFSLPSFLPQPPNLNRTLDVPPVLDHHALALGSCPKFRVLPSRDIRLSVWDSSLRLLRNNRYVSMADIVDVSSLVSSSTIRTIAFRVFASWWCGVKIELACSNQSTSLEPLVFDRLKDCGSFLAGFGGNVDGCLYAIDEDCRNTVWIYGKDEEDGNSEADRARLLAFGSLFTAPYKVSQLYIDIDKYSKNSRLQKLLEDTDFLPFAPQIVNSGKQYALNIIKDSFLCAQQQLLDGQFKNHWKATFSSLKEQIKSLRQGASFRTINIFVMTDLPEGNWSSTYFGELMRDKDSYRLHFLRGDDLVHDTSRELAVAGKGYRLGITPCGFKGHEEIKMNCSPQRLPDVLLYIEEVICSCPSLGFVGTAGSTIAGEDIKSARVESTLHYGFFQNLMTCPHDVVTTTITGKSHLLGGNLEEELKLIRGTAFSWRQ